MVEDAQGEPPANWEDCPQWEDAQLESPAHWEAQWEDAEWEGPGHWKNPAQWANPAQWEDPAEMEDPQWQDLPSELLLKISTSCNGGCNGMRGVCQAWKTGLESICTRLKVVQTPIPRSLPDRFLSLARLDLDRSTPPWVTPRDLRALGVLPLTSLALKLPAEKISHMLTRDLRALNLTQLDLELSGIPHSFTNAHLRRLAGLPILKLDLADTFVGNGGMLAICELPLLSDLSLSCTLVGGVGVNTIVPGLVTNAGLETLRGLPLTLLHLKNRTSITDSGLESLRGMPLGCLNLAGCSLITDAGLEVLADLPLTRLDLTDLSLVTANGLDVLRGKPLTALSLGRFGVNAVVEVLRGMPLVELHAEHCKFLDSGLGFLRGMPLRILTLNLSTATNLGLGVLRNLPLTRLALCLCTRITDVGLLFLRGVLLKHFEMSDCPGITSGGVLTAFQGKTGLFLRFVRCPGVSVGALRAVMSEEDDLLQIN